MNNQERRDERLKVDYKQVGIEWKMGVSGSLGPAPPGPAVYTQDVGQHRIHYVHYVALVPHWYPGRKESMDCYHAKQSLTNERAASSCRLGGHKPYEQHRLTMMPAASNSLAADRLDLQYHLPTPESASLKASRSHAKRMDQERSLIVGHQLADSYHGFRFDLPAVEV